MRSTKQSPESGVGRLWLLLLSALLVFTWLSARGLNADLLWLDEYFSVGNIGGILRVPYTPAQVWESISQYSPQHVPGYFILLSGWVALTGWTPFAMRALSLLFGLLAIALTYRLGAEWVSRRVGLYAALVLSVSALLVHFAHELRMYTLMALLTVFLLWVYRRVVTPGRQPKRWEWAGLFFGAVSVIWVHYVSGIVVVAVGLYHLLFVPKNRRWLWVTVLLGLACLSFLPWLQFLLVGARFVNVEEDTGVPVRGPLGILQLLANLFANGGAVLLVGLAALSLIRIRQRAVREVLFFTVAIFALTVIVNEIVPMVNENRPRYLIHLWPLLALVVGLGLVALRWRYRVAALLLLGVWLGLGVVQSLNPQFLIELDGPRYTRLMPPLREIIAQVNRLGDPDDMVIAFSRDRYLFEEVKFGPVAEFYLRELRMGSYLVTLPEPRPPAEIEDSLRDAVGTRLNVWFATEPALEADMLTLYRQALEASYTLCGTALNQPHLQIEHYALAVFGCLDDAPPAGDVATFDGGITLTAVRTAPDGGGLLLASGWSISETVPPEMYSVSFKLWDEAGEIAAQHDDGLRAAGFGWQLAALPVADLPAGTYTLTATVYDWRTGATMTGSSGDTSGELVPVQEITLPLPAQ